MPLKPADFAEAYNPAKIQARKRAIVQGAPLRKLVEPPVLEKVNPKVEDGAVKGVNFVNLDGILRKPRNRVTLVGVELEGGWSEGGERDVAVVRDGSVFKDSDAGGLARNKYPNYYCGEIPIGPMQVGQMPAAMKKYWPNVIDKSCGMHLHMSFESYMQYNILADSPAYQETVMEYLRRWAKEEGFPEKDPIWPRLQGKSEYCQRKFWPMAQMDQKKKDHDKERFGHRYTAIHYCWERTKTVECRLLPMMATVEQGIRAVRRVIDITNAYLLAAEKQRVKEYGAVAINAGGGKDVRIERTKDRVKVILDSGDVYEEYIQVKI